MGIRTPQTFEDLTTLHPASEWHEDDGTVLWWHVPVREPPFVGTPGDSDGIIDRLIGEGCWFTHWTRLPNISGIEEAKAVPSV